MMKVKGMKEMTMVQGKERVGRDRRSRCPRGLDQLLRLSGRRAGRTERCRRRWEARSHSYRLETRVKERTKLVRMTGRGGFGGRVAASVWTRVRVKDKKGATTDETSFGDGRGQGHQWVRGGGRPGIRSRGRRWRNLVHVTLL